MPGIFVRSVLIISLISIASVGCASTSPTASEPTSLQFVSPSPSKAGSNAPSPAIDVSGIAAAAGVAPAAILPTEDGAIAAKRADGRTLLLWISRESGTWKVTTLAEVDETWPENAAYSSVYVVVCRNLGLSRTTYVFGASTDHTERQLRLDPAVGIGAVLIDMAWAFALDPSVTSDMGLKILGSRPLPFAEVGSLRSTTLCRADTR